MSEIRLNRTVLNISGVCNLRCKHCLAFIPYYKEKWIMSAEEAEKIIDMYFKVVDCVGTFTITGGEPLLNKETMEILNLVNRHRDKIEKSIDFVTNGTILIPDNILQFFSDNKDRSRVILSDYGAELSKMIPLIEESLKKHNITYRISKFSGDDLYYDGWIDFSDHSLKWKTTKEREENSKKCIHSAGKYFVINEGCIHRCSRSFWRMKNGIIPYTKGEFCDLMNPNQSIEEKKGDLLCMMNSVSSTSCSYCVGLVNGVPRVKPAIQIEN